MKIKGIGVLSVLFLVANVYAQTEVYGDLNINRNVFTNLSVSEPKPAIENSVKDNFVLKNNTNLNKSYATRIGTINGTIGKGQVNITINKIAWTITGNISSKEVKIKIDNDNMLINGNIGNDSININFKWSPEAISMEGSLGQSPLEYNLVWKNGELTGIYNSLPVNLVFDMKEGVAGENMVNIKGNLNSADVKLVFDKVSGDLKGQMNNASVSLKLVNCDLYDFIQYFFVFAK
ncbi:MAG: hypothetical protein KA059_08875 [Elusimicrobiales bacterium]|nr:hypothetical protein [Elusimicrobiales bacterium]